MTATEAAAIRHAVAKSFAAAIVNFEDSEDDAPVTAIPQRRRGVASPPEQRPAAVREEVAS